MSNHQILRRTNECGITTITPTLNVREDLTVNQAKRNKISVTDAGA